MVFARIFVALAVAVLLGMAGPAAAAPLEAYGRLPKIESIDLSPSGERLAVVTTDGERRRIGVRDLASGEFVAVADAGEKKVRGLHFATEQRLLIYWSQTGQPRGVIAPRAEWLQASVFEIDTKRVRPLLRAAEDAMNTIHGEVAVRTVQGKPYAFVQGIQFVSRSGVKSLYRIDLETLDMKLVETGGGHTRDWLVDVDGQVLAQEVYDGDSGRWALKFRSGLAWRESGAVTAKLDRPYVAGLGRDGKSVLVDLREKGWSEVKPGADGWGDPVPTLDNQSPIFDPRDGRLVGHYALIGNQGRYVFFDAPDRAAWDGVAAAFPNRSVGLMAWSANRRRIIVRTDSPADGPAYAFVDLDARKLEWLGPEYDELKPADIGPKRVVRFKAADGLELSGYITLPPGREAKSLPLVVFPHGGPASRDRPGFDWWAQGMASRGYAVLQINFRGSDGLGRDLLEAGYGQWGRKMQTDLSDGVKALVGTGLIDPKRVCIVGASYGGYAALAGVTLDPGVYRCAVSVAGVSDLPRMVEQERRDSAVAHRYWLRFMGAEKGGEAGLADISPSAQAAKAYAPILLIHGKDDTVVPLEQSQRMADALKKAGKPFELIVQDRADHSFIRGATRLQTLAATVAFLEKHNPPN